MRYIARYPCIQGAGFFAAWLPGYLVLIGDSGGFNNVDMTTGIFVSGTELWGVRVFRLYPYKRNTRNPP